MKIYTHPTHISSRKRIYIFVCITLFFFYFDYIQAHLFNRHKVSGKICFLHAVLIYMYML